MQGQREKASDQDFRTLGLPPQASRSEVKKVYREMVRRWHPDHFQQRTPQEQREAEERLKEITGAYRRISQSWSEQKRTGPQPPPESQPRAHPGPQPHKQAPPKAAPSPQTNTAWKNAYHKIAPWSFFTASQHRTVCLLLGLSILLLLAVINILPHRKEPQQTPDAADTRRGVGMQLNSRNPPSPPETPVTPDRAADGQSAPVATAPPPLEAPSAPKPGVTSEYFTLGTSQAEVLRIQGPPGKVRGQTWTYNLSEVQFKNGRVYRYNNFDGSLKVRLLPSNSLAEVPPFFTLGSIEDEVLAVQGTPTRILNQTWYYGFSEVRFRDGRVVAFDNYFGNLRVRMLPSAAGELTARKGYFTIGSSQDEVLVAQGTPTSVQGNMWFYRFSNILFRHGKVESVFDSPGILNYVPPESRSTQADNTVRSP